MKKIKIFVGSVEQVERNYDEWIEKFKNGVNTPDGIIQIDTTTREGFHEFCLTVLYEDSLMLLKS
jgi:hypothetical protein